MNIENDHSEATLNIYSVDHRSGHLAIYSLYHETRDSLRNFESKIRTEKMRHFRVIFRTLRIRISYYKRCFGNRFLKGCWGFFRIIKDIPDFVTDF